MACSRSRGEIHQQRAALKTAAFTFDILAEIYASLVDIAAENFDIRFIIFKIGIFEKVVLILKLKLYELALNKKS